jgi:hypothetical protein
MKRWLVPGLILVLVQAWLLLALLLLWREIK